MELNKNKFLNSLKSYEYITFDIFDTLITRCILNPNDLIKLIDYKVAKKFKLPPKTFIKIWSKATKHLSNLKKKKDINFFDIYKYIENKSNLSNSQLEWIKNTHFETELSLVVPRLDMLDIYNQLIKEGKKIIIISDMYYPSSFLKKLLNKCGYYHFEKIIVSNEYEATKASGLLWKKFAKEYKNINSIHIGDSNRSDYLKPKSHKINALKIKKGKTVSAKTYFGLNNQNIFMSLIYGTIINKCLFNSPFKSKKHIIDSPDKFGYCVLGPVFLYFYNWLLKNINTSQFLFASREGWYLQKMYHDYIKIFKDSLDTKLPSSVYLYTSRRAVLAASIQTWDDIKFVCTFKLPHFKGDSKLFFKSKFNIHIKDSENFIVSALKKKQIINLAKKYKNQILTNSKLERKNYLAYLKNIVKKDGVLIDYSGLGTIQYFLSKILKRNILGVYISKAPSKKFDKLGIKRIGAFPFKFKNFFTLGIVGNIFESFLTAPHGQFQRIDNANKPIFANDVMSKQSISVHDSVYEGIKLFFSDIEKLLPKNWQLSSTNAATIFSKLNKFYLNFKSKPVCDDLIDFFQLTDVFSGASARKFIKRK